MSEYCTVPEVGSMGIEPDAYAEKSPDDITAQVKSTSSEMDSYIGAPTSQYTLPLIAPFPDVLRKCCAALAACDLVDVGGRDPNADSLIDITRKRWLDWLKMIKDGGAIPGVTDSTPPPISGAAGSSRVASSSSRGYSVRGTGQTRGPFQVD